jgi:hypothetical protein
MLKNLQTVKNRILKKNSSVKPKKIKNNFCSFYFSRKRTEEKKCIIDIREHIFEEFHRS